MIKKLRLRFVVLAMGSLLLMLAITMCAINVLNYSNITEEADTLLALLADNNGVFPKLDVPDGPVELDNKLELSPESPYENRYFSVRLSSGGETLAVDTVRIAAVDSETAEAYALEVHKSGRERGFSGDYRYLNHAESDGGSLIIFLDCGRSLNTFRSFLLTSLGICLAGLAVVFLLLVFFSGRIIKPVSESYEKQKRFITDAGHEIKTPLTIIDADTEILVMEQGENEWLRDIRSQTQRLAELTKDLISLSRMEEDRPPLQLLEFPFSDLVEEEVQSFSSLARVRGKSFEGSVQPLLAVKGDEKALRQLLSILLDNALKYSGENGRISLTLDRHGKFVRLVVTNSTASEVTQEQLGHLFDRFYRADPSRNSGTGGYGIGLSIARAVVAAHRGKISALAPDGHTLSIVVLLPAAA